MANLNKPQGLLPVGHMLGLNWTGNLNVYYLSSSESNAIAIGDPVASSGSADANGVPGITLATAGTGNPIRGVVVGLGKYETLIANPSNLDTTVRAASTAAYALVVDDPYVIFEVQEIGTGTYFTAAEVGLNANLVAGTNNGYISGWLLDNSGETTTATLQVRLLGLSRRSDNAFGQYAKWRVLINNHELKAGTVGL